MDIAKRYRKNIDISEHLTVVARVLAWDIDPHHNLVNESKVAHQITPYVLSDMEVCVNETVVGLS